MKKLIIAMAAVVFATVIQAATFNWTSTAVAYGLNATTVIDNGDYTASTTKMRNNGTWAYVLSIYEAGSTTLIGSASGTIGLGSTGKVSTTGITIGDAAAQTTYDYVISLTGTQTSLTARGKEAEFDYSNAALETVLSGSVTTVANGTTALSTSAPSSWTVSGIVPVPEPTSGLLMLLGMAGLALRRRRA